MSVEDDVWDKKGKTERGIEKLSVKSTNKYQPRCAMQQKHCTSHFFVEFSVKIEYNYIGNLYCTTVLYLGG